MLSFDSVGHVVTRTSLTFILAVAASTFDKAKAAPIVAGEDRFSSAAVDALMIGGVFGEFLADSQGIPGILLRELQVGTTIGQELVSLDLFGPDPFRPGESVHIRVGAGNASPVLAGGTFGRIENIVLDSTDPGFAVGSPTSFESGDSFFDVFFEVDTVVGTVYNKDPLRLEARISDLPPIGTPFTDPNQVDLYLRVGADPNLDPLVGRHLDFIWTVTAPIPEPTALSIWCVIGMAGICFGRWRRRKPSPAEARHERPSPWFRSRKSTFSFSTDRERPQK